MKYIKNIFLFFIFTIAIFCGFFLFTNSQAAHANTINLNLTIAEVYEQRSNHNPDGIGKFYMGREIARVMGHTGAGWLERGSREVEEQPSKIVDALKLQSDSVVADIGAGTGYLSFLIAPHLPQGRVFAVDIQPEMLEIIGYFQEEKNVTNIKPILATETNPNLSTESIDLALMVDAYHEFAYPREMLKGIVKALKKGGRVALVEYRGENPFIMIKSLHKMTQKQVKKEMQAVGLVWRETNNVLPQQHIIIFEKPNFV
ncbi:MAG: class I SAM-dependent methyltransferase [Methylacidiphilales bacterium]|nr:class I SAM-dependent methyltransferase [Candidatus Methylacidiphilales bacterium]NJR14742.1 class I SAM-dependent methyltransferase [Calothrix sp. CSU_2_0]